MNRRFFLVGFGALALHLTSRVLPSIAKAAENRVTVELDVSEVPDLRLWGEKAKSLVEEWYPRMANLLPSKGFAPPKKVELTLRKRDKGIASTSGNKIQVHSNWIEKHPDDFGLVIHEAVHVLQAYPPQKEGWLVEGIADYLRWGIYEGQPLSKFPVPNQPQGYRQSYQMTAGFLLWLESDRAPGIVNKLNVSLRQNMYDPKLFERESQRTLDALWDEYQEARRKPQ